MVAKMISSFPRSSNAEAFNEKYLSGQIALELVPQGTLAERIRAAGAGIPAFYTPSSYGTELAEGKPTEEFDGKMYVREGWLRADFALIKGQLGDTLGNLTYRLAGRNFNPLMAMAADKTIAQVSSLSEPGSIDPEQVVTPGIFVDTIVEVPDPQQEEVLVRTGVVY
jgi:3-oxoadipate CoA-transferase alpha subunit